MKEFKSDAAKIAWGGLVLLVSSPICGIIGAFFAGAVGFMLVFGLLLLLSFLMFLISIINYFTK